VSVKTTSVRTTIAAAPSDVYALVSDITRYGEWSPENLGGTWLDGADGAAVGAKFKAKNKRKLSWTTTCTVTKADAGRAFEFETGNGDTRWRYDVHSTGDGSTEVVETVELVKEPGGFLKFLTKLATGVSWKDRMADIEQGMRTTLERLRAAAEGH
jgi:hypothetical protein